MSGIYSNRAQQDKYLETTQQAEEQRKKAFAEAKAAYLATAQTAEDADCYLATKQAIMDTYYKAENEAWETWTAAEIQARGLEKV